MFQRSGSPSSFSTGNSDGGQPQSAPGSPSSLGGRRAMSVLNVATTGGSMSREKNATGGSGKGSTISASGLTRYNTEFGFNTGYINSKYKLSLFSVDHFLGIMIYFTVLKLVRSFESVLLIR